MQELLQRITDALAKAMGRGTMPTPLGTEELRELGEEVLSRSVFTARGTNAVFVDMLKTVVDEIAAGDMDLATARVTLLETLRATGYTPEGGFPDAPPGSVPPALAGTLQDLSSSRRLNLIVETQRGLMVGAGQKRRGSTPERLEQFPAWELVRQIPVEVPRTWPTRWAIAGGRLTANGRMIAAKGDPIWGELGSYQNFEDALGVDHPPFAFNSGMGWREISKGEAARLGITGPNGEPLEDFLASEPATLGGKQPLPVPSISLRDMDPDIRDGFIAATGAVVVDDQATLPGGREALEQRTAEREERRAKRLADSIAARQAEYEGRGE